MSLFIVANKHACAQSFVFSFCVECCSESHTKAGVSSGLAACRALGHLNLTLLARGAVGPLTSVSWPITNELKQLGNPPLLLEETIAFI